MQKLSITITCRFKKEWNARDVGPIPAGETGKVVDCFVGNIFVKLDRHFPHLDEWDNCVHFDDETQLREYCDLSV